LTIFCDASALIAIIAGEPDADQLADALGRDPVRLCSALSMWETTAGLCRSYAFSPPAARAHIERYAETADIRFVAVGENEYEIAVDAYARFGRGRHPAALNMGDCHAYACTKTNGAVLLFKGGDISLTDIERATV
jgi:ribonuclease VapC